MTEFLKTEPIKHHTDESTPSNRSRPRSWPVYRASIGHPWAIPFLFVDWMAQWAAFGLRRLSILELMETCSSFTLLIGLIFYVVESPQRTKTKHYQAWQVINTAQGKGGSGGRTDALHELNEDGVPLVGVDLTDAFLQNLQLEHADLRRSTFHGTDLKGSKLRDSNLEQSVLISANLREANLIKVDFSEANLMDSDLSGANLDHAELKDVNLSKADLRGADFKDVREWKSIASVKLANIHQLKNAPEGFIDWAKAHGAVDLESDEQWTEMIAKDGR